VTVTGVNNDIIDGQRVAPITINVAADQSDSAYAGVFQQIVAVTVTDDDAPGVVITESAGSTRVRESGTIDTFNVVLAAQPASTVVVNLASLNQNEVTIDRNVLTFSPQNWNVPRVVTVLGKDDSVVDGGTSTVVAVSIDTAASDPVFGQLSTQNVNVTNVDDDVAGFVVSESDLATVVTENGRTDLVGVVLTARPLTDVVLTVASSDTTEATVDVTELRFTPAGWNVPQFITVIGADDNQLDGNDTSVISIDVQNDATDFRFRDLPGQSFVSITEDNDQAGFVVSKTTGTVQESGTTETIAVTLTASPIADVVIDVRAEDPSELIVSPMQLVFSTNTWNVSQVVTVTGFRDNIADGDQVSDVRLSINVEASQSAFDALADQTVAITTIDGDNNDRPFVLSPTGLIDQLRPTLVWSPVPNAVSYQLLLDQVGGDSILDQVVNGTSYALTQDLTVGQYRTWIRANFNDSSASEFDNKTFGISAAVTLHELPFFGTSGRPVISWDAVTGAVGYRIQINNSTTSEVELVDEIVTDTSFTPASDLRFGRHQIWVRPVGPGNFQSTWTLTEYYVGTELSGPIGTITTASPEFSWTAVDGASSYHLYVVGPGGVLINETAITGTTFAPSSPFVNGDFRWWVRPSTADGNAGAWSPVAEFSTGGRSKVGTTGALFRKAGLTTNRYPSPVLVDGDYKVWIRAKTAAGNVWGRSIEFTVAASAVIRSTAPLSPDGPGLDRSPQFAWRPTSEATSYELYLHNGTSAILQTGITDVTWTPAADLASAEWTWSVRPVTAAGAGWWSSPLSTQRWQRMCFVRSSLW
jgi:hypothetical protein